MNPKPKFQNPALSRLNQAVTECVVLFFIAISHVGMQHSASSTFGTEPIKRDTVVIVARMRIGVTMTTKFSMMITRR